MFYRKILLLFLFTILCTKAFSAVFVVTSNADAGPGTLREALTKAAANGSAEKDYINFNLPDLSEAGRTIMVNTLLPDISKNLVIDGATQAGTPFGVSASKVEIHSTYTSLDAAKMYVLNGDRVDDFSMSGIYLNTASPYYHKNNIISITNSKSINIDHCLIQSGAVYIYNCSKFTFQSNMIGYLPDGITGYQSAVSVWETLNVIIGGDDPEQGNLSSGAIFLATVDLVQEWSYNISNNKLGTDYTGTSSSVNLYSDYGRIEVESGFTPGPNNVIMHGVINNNEVVNFSSSGLYINGKGNVSIKGNLIGTDKEGKTDFRQFMPDYTLNYRSPTGMVLQIYVDAVVGGDNPGDSNTIAYLSNGILEQLANTVVISHNSIFCLDKQYFNIHDFVTQAYEKPLPLVQINSITSNIVSGTATPGARVELFSNDEGECPNCDPRHFFTYVTADAKGNWSYTGAIPSNIVASAIYNQQTSRFTKAEIDIKHLKVTQPQCGAHTGSIQGMKFHNTSQIQWVDQDGNPVSNTLDINNLAPGKYKLKVGSEACGAESGWIEIIDNSIKIDAAEVKLKHPSCNIGGSISGLVVTAYKNETFTSVWLDDNLNPVGNSTDISNLPSGTYTLKVTGNTTDCSQTYGPVILNNTTGPNIDQTNAKTQSTNCGETTGAVTNITVTGTGSLKYSWKNSQQQEVGTSKDLTGQPGGLYTLEVTDDTQCGPVYSTQIEIPEVNGITLDESKTKPTSASCSMDNGTITGIAVTGNALYKWVDANGKIAGTSPDLTNAAPGDYVFTAYNNAGCSKTSQSYHIGLQQPTQFPVYQSTIVPACFAANNGSVNITADALVKSVRWVNGQGQSIADNVIRTGIAAGMYKLYLTDQNGCETFYKSYTVPEIPVFDVTGTGQVTNDNCGLKTGSISGPVITGGLPPYSYIWRNSEGVQIGSGNSLSGLGAGEYKLSIADTRCGNADIPYIVFDVAETVAAPSVANVQLCSAGNAVVKVNNPSANILYRLYADAGSAQPLQEQVGGTFKVTATTSTNFYVSQLTGTCESDRTAVSVSVGLSSINIANAFTPNNDGINDYWKIPGIENYPAALVQVFSRYGQKVFESKGYSHPFDGTLNGNNLPVGAYYYIINLSSNCSVLSGSLSIIR